MNDVKIFGRLTADPIVKETASGEALSFTLADHRKDSKAQPNADPIVQYVPVTLFGKAVAKGKELKKGDYIEAVGRLQVATNKTAEKTYVNWNVVLYRFKKRARKAAAKKAA